MIWKKLLTSPFTVVETRFYPEKKKSKGVTVKTARITTIDLLPPYYCHAGLLGCMCVSAMEQGGTTWFLSTKDMEQIQHQHQLSGMHHQQRDACDADEQISRGRRKHLIAHRLSPVTGSLITAVSSFISVCLIVSFFMANSTYANKYLTRNL